VGDYGPWPPQFREKKIYCGLAGAAIVSISKENYNDDGFFSSHSSPSPANFKLTPLPGQRTLHHLILSLEASTTFLFSTIFLKLREVHVTFHIIFNVLPKGLPIHYTPSSFLGFQHLMCDF
jgi:hypothetical protein